MKPFGCFCLALLLLGLAGCETTGTTSPAAPATPTKSATAAPADKPEPRPEPPAAALGSSTPSEQPPELLNRRPVERFVAQADYSYDLRKAGIEGRVVVEFIIDTNGDVVAPFVVSATHPALAAPALAAISRCKYSPGMKNGHPVNCRMQQSLTFSLGQTK
ncbi:MAG: TonB family protein [Verrucomicrobia bacterium]|nr:TonB family protein [Verrucomicrobiota bacterium]